MTNELEGRESDDSIMCEGRGAHETTQFTRKQSNSVDVHVYVGGSGTLASRPQMFDYKHIICHNVLIDYNYMKQWSS